MGIDRREHKANLAFSIQMQGRSIRARGIKFSDLMHKRLDMGGTLNWFLRVITDIKHCLYGRFGSKRAKGFSNVYLHFALT